ncbi:hypothetical protein HG536_0C05280 [Torulaspora globosa]|uniref:Coatomer subunit epsilon n=1 Tax=Torulaspora globosa TaxID=48254 RepID=A0A7G3ZFS3_9SACH|nr:uncharacterized protein HG536_0C05280 [Torulaspora globosa]QLL32359.1 hypothetical protein HG536_0C05280 [Torulaspora globosa]
MNYFTIKQCYYTGDYPQTLQEIAKLNKVTDDTLTFYKHSASLALGRFETVEGSGKLDRAFKGYYEFLQSKDISQLKQLVSRDNGSPFELFLLALAESVLGNFEEGLQTCVAGIDNDEPVGTPELLLLAVQIALLMARPSTASTMLGNYASANEELLSSEDELIVNLAESYIKYAANQETTRSNFYYFEELSQSVPTWKTQLALLNSHLQQGNLPEASAVVELLESEHYAEGQKEVARLYRPHFLASKISLSIALNHGDADELREELAQLAPDSAFSSSHRDLQAKFDELVAKYSS